MKIRIKGFKKTLTELNFLYFTSFIVSLLVIIPISNFLLEGIDYIISGNFSLGIAGGEEVLGFKSSNTDKFFWWRVRDFEWMVTFKL